MKKPNMFLHLAATGVLYSLLLFLLFRAFAWAGEVTENGEGTSTETVTSHASNDNVCVVSSRSSSDGIYVYLRDAGQLGKGTTVQIGNTICEDISVTDIDAMDVPIKTLILLDNSLSLSTEWGNQALELIDGIIENHADGEMFKVCTFLSTLTVLSDYSDDYGHLHQIVQGIEYQNSESYLTDILYDLAQREADNEEPNFTRFIIISDGADDQEIGYTMTELKDMLKRSGVVVHTIGVKKGNNNSALETLFSFSRVTNGYYQTVDHNTPSADVLSVLKSDYDLCCLKVIPEVSLMDGSTREARLNLVTDRGDASLRTTFIMPFGNGVAETEQEEEEENEEPEENIETEEVVSTPQNTIPVISTNTTEKEGVPVWLLILIIILVVAAIAMIIVLIVVLSKQKPKQEPQQPLDHADPKGENGGTTILIDSNGGGLQEGPERPMWSTSKITLTDVNNPSVKYCVPINERIRIGRAKDQGQEIVLDYDKSVSGIHCEIVKEGNLYYVVDKKSTNHTYIGGRLLIPEKKEGIVTGEIITIGKSNFRFTVEN